MKTANKAIFYRCKTSSSSTVETFTTTPHCRGRIPTARTARAGPTRRTPTPCCCYTGKCSVRERCHLHRFGPICLRLVMFENLPINSLLPGCHVVASKTASHHSLLSRLYSGRLCLPLPKDRGLLHPGRVKAYYSMYSENEGREAGSLNE